MKYAVISDVHGNLPALDAVLTDAREQRVDGYLFTGDYLVRSPYPEECIRRIRELPGVLAIRGNEEQRLEALSQEPPEKASDFSDQMGVSRWAVAHTSRESLEYALSLPREIHTELGGLPVHMFHSADSLLGPFLSSSWEVAKVYGSRFLSSEEFRRDAMEALQKDASARTAAENLPSGVYLFSHTHLQWDASFKGGRVTLINPGSCGLPLDCVRYGVPYTLLEIGEGGEVTVTPRRVSFDFPRYCDDLIRSPLYEAVPEFSAITVEELRLRRARTRSALEFVEAYAQSIGDSRRPFATDTWQEGCARWFRSMRV